MPEIQSFRDVDFTEIHPADATGRSIGYTVLRNVSATGKDIFYPNVLFQEMKDSILVSPYDEKIMSLRRSSFYDDNRYEPVPEKNPKQIIPYPVFFFVYNTENYYHFLYDTLPILYTYFWLKARFPELRLLVQFPNKYKKEHFRFNTELLELCGIGREETVVCSSDHMYETVFISTSLTHGGFSNEPPRPEFRIIYDKIKENAKRRKVRPEYRDLSRVYVSRRTWIHNDWSNIGTNYTTKRKMMNEDELIEALEKIGFTEIFTEQMETHEKIHVFSRASIVCGSIGGGMANLVFCRPETTAVVIVSPFFLEINQRFRYCLESVVAEVIYSHDTRVHAERDVLPMHCRVRIVTGGSKDKIGEIKSHDSGRYLIRVSDNDVAGFAHDREFREVWFFPEDFDLLDHGLNAPYTLDIRNYITTVKYLLVNRK